MSASLTIAAYKKAWLVTGETLKAKSALKDLKGSWNKVLGGWVFAGARKDAVIEGLREKGHKVTHSTAAADPSSAAAAGAETAATAATTTPSAAAAGSSSAASSVAAVVPSVNAKA